MSAQAASIGSLISALLLSDQRVLRLSWSTPFTSQLDWSTLRVPTYLAFQPWAARFPDHVFDTSWQFLTDQQPGQGVLLTTLKALVDEFLEQCHGEVRIRHDLLGAWQQGVLSRISSIPIQAASDIFFDTAMYAKTGTSHNWPGTVNRESASWQRKIMPRLRPEEAVVADYVEKEGLHETHLHLNGSTHAEICWLRALRSPQAETKEFVDAWTGGKQSGRLRELVGQANPDLTPLVFYQHLRAASRLRSWLIAAATDEIAPNTRLPVSCQRLCEAADDEWSVGLSMQALSWRHQTDVVEEFTWMARLIGRLSKHPSVQLTRMFHSYLLLLNEYYRLLVQSEGQYGFDQFQKYTLTELREPAERDYRARFHDMHGRRSAVSTVGYLEGRFAPKDKTLKAYNLFRSILGGYLEYLHDASNLGHRPSAPPYSLSKILNDLDRYFERPITRHRNIHRLTLVAHFIKQPWTHSPHHKAGLYRHYSLDLQLRRAVGVLLLCLARWPRLQTWVRGIDAAANELHAPPDVFAAVFRVCRRAGLTRRTYHAGEDFRHLLSGIATMWDALTLLELRNGDRIGHGTAMGIRPSLWLERMPSRLTISRGEWLISMLAAWQLLRDVSEAYACANRLQRELEDIAYQIFRRPITAKEVERAMALRGLNRKDLMQQQTFAANPQPESLSEPWREEQELVMLTCQSQPRDVALLWEWLSDPDVQQRAEELIVKEARFLDEFTYVRLQQALMRQVATRGVLIETLPSSNVRISQYYHVGEHHSLRWMRVPGHVEEGDPEIMVCLGSDDPGVFAGELETEFYLLFAELRRAGLSSSEALNRLSAMNERGRTYRFHHPSLS